MRKWIAHHPQLPDKWVAQILKIGRRTQTKKNRKNKKNTPPLTESYLLSDGRVWNDMLTADVLLLFQMLMAEEAKLHPLPEDAGVQLEGANVLDSVRLEKHPIRESFPVSHMDHQVVCALEILEHSVFNPAQPSSPLVSPVEGMSDCWIPVMTSEDALKERCGMFIADVAATHPSLFLRYQKIIHRHLSRSALSWVAVNTKKEYKTYRQTLEDLSFLTQGAQGSSTGDSGVSPVPPLEASGHRTDGTRIGGVRFTASFASIKPYFWEVIFSSFEAMNPLLCYLHVSSTELGMEDCVNLISELADRRMVSL